MKYYRQKLFGEIENLNEQGQEMQPWEAAEMIEKLSKQLKKYHLGMPEQCKMENGEERWMVAYPKYSRVVAENWDLKRENQKLWATVKKLIELDNEE